MVQGRTQAALQLLSDRTQGCPLSLDALLFPDNPSSGSVLHHLIQKHPSPQSINEGKSYYSAQLTFLQS